MKESNPYRCKDHPELQEGEVWILNLLLGLAHHRFVTEEVKENDLVQSGLTAWEQIRWTTKRLGRVAYSRKGDQVPGMVPVFAQLSEVTAKGVNLENASSLERLGH